MRGGGMEGGMRPRVIMGDRRPGTADLYVGLGRIHQSAAKTPLQKLQYLQRRP